VALMDGLRPAAAHHMDLVETPSLRQSAPLMRELRALRAALQPPPMRKEA
jgi:hypothetical protein